MNTKNMMKSAVTILLLLVACVFGCTKQDDPNNENNNEGENINAPVGAIEGLFSVGNNVKVFFSQGNLQYQASSNTWRFANNQFDFIGYDNSNISSAYNGWIDLFGWGTSGNYHGALCYQPWSISENVADYVPYDSNIFYNLSDQSGQADWGYNAISNGGNDTKKWRTLTQAEWYYVFNTRNTLSGIRYAKAQVNSVNGIILLPDNWNDNIYQLNNVNANGTDAYENNIIDALDWLNTFQKKGAVFLPAAGERIGQSVYYLPNQGNYWSSSHNGEGQACEVAFIGRKILPNYSCPRYYGLSVRLVQNAE